MNTMVPRSPLPHPRSTRRFVVPALAGAAGLALFLVAREATRRYLQMHPFHAYGFEWFLKFGPGEAGFYWRYGLLGGAASALLALGLRPLLERVPRPPIRWRSGIVALALLAGALLVTVGWGVLGNEVVTDDENVYVFQARMLEQGRAAWPPPPSPDFFENVFVVVQDGRWFGQYPPGHPLLLLPGVALGIPRLMPVLLGMANVILMAAILRRLFGAGWGLAGGFLLATSPLFLLTGATLLSHSTAFFGLALATWGAVRADPMHPTRSTAVVGAGLAVAFLARPYTGLTLGPLPLVLLWLHTRGIRTLALPLLGLGAGVGLLLVYQKLTTGDPFLTGYAALRRAQGMVEFGFGTIIPGVHEHTLGRGLLLVLRQLVRLHAWALGWPVLVAALGPAVIAGRAGWGQDPGRRAAVLVAAGAGALGVLAYVPYWSLGVCDTGPVKLFEVLLPFAIAATGVAHGLAPRYRAAAGAVVLASLASAWLVFWPPQLRHLRELTRQVGEPIRVVEATVRRPALVFMASPQPETPVSWVYGRPNPRPGLKDPILYVRDLGARNEVLARAFPERNAYRLERRAGHFEAVPLNTPGPR